MWQGLKAYSGPFLQGMLAAASIYTGTLSNEGKFYKFQFRILTNFFFWNTYEFMSGRSYVGVGRDGLVKDATNKRIYEYVYY